jgi:glycosyltransferase involved in cell wall biosynthesis
MYHRLGEVMVKRVLMIAYHFPPVKVSSGIQRTLRFAQYLPESGWSPIVLAPHRRAYTATSQEDMNQVASMDVCRAFALDTSKHLSIGGYYPRLAALPDRWSSWWLGAVPAGLLLIRKFRPDVIWSTYPIATAHLIGLTLRRLSGIPWVADFRDPMAQEGYPADPLIWKSFDWIEKRVVRYADAVTFTTPGALREYTHRYPDIAGRFSLIENGYDESAFTAVDVTLDKQPSHSPTEPFTLVHSGLIYPEERDPRQFFEALAGLLNTGEISPQLLRIVLRATGHDDYLQKLVDQYGIQSIVTLAPSVPYIAALREMTTADALLILQAANCNDQIPAKLYECLRARRPILGLTDPAGDTGKALVAAGIHTIAPLDSVSAIQEVLRRFIALLRSGKAPIADDAVIATSSRQSRTLEFAQLLDRIS